MEALDYFVDTPEGRSRFPNNDGALPSDEEALEKIVGRVYMESGGTAGIPSKTTVTVHVESQWHTYQTTWERNATHFLLRLGWNPMKDGSSGFIYQWPCGAL
jgi:hypothetical protein